MRSRAAWLLLFALVALLGLQLEVHAHALSHLPAQPHAEPHDSAGDRTGDDEHDAESLCLDCLALAALDLPPAGRAPFAFGDGGGSAAPVPPNSARRARDRLRPRCRAPPPSRLPRPIT